MKTVTVLLYDGVNELDFCGPYEALASTCRLIGGKWSDEPAFAVHTVGEHSMTVECAHGLRVFPEKSVTQAGPPDILIVPGGPAARTKEFQAPFLEYIRKANLSADAIASVGTGSFLLARAGLTDGWKVTTHSARVEDLARRYPKTTVIRGERIVVSGRNNNLLTSAGITAGIDLSLAIIERFVGQEAMRRVAQRLEWAVPAKSGEQA